MAAKNISLGVKILIWILYNGFMALSCRGMDLGGDIDNLLNSSVEEFDAALKKYCATKNVKPETAIRWAAHRATSEEHRKQIMAKFQAVTADSAALFDDQPAAPAEAK